LCRTGFIRSGKNHRTVPVLHLWLRKLDDLSRLFFSALGCMVRVLGCSQSNLEAYRFSPSVLLHLIYPFIHLPGWRPIAQRGACLFSPPFFFFLPSSFLSPVPSPFSRFIVVVARQLLLLARDMIQVLMEGALFSAELG